MQRSGRQCASKEQAEQRPDTHAPDTPARPRDARSARPTLARLPSFVPPADRASARLLGLRGVMRNAEVPRVAHFRGPACCQHAPSVKKPRNLCPIYSSVSRTRLPAWGPAVRIPRVISLGWQGATSASSPRQAPLSNARRDEHGATHGGRSGSQPATATYASCSTPRQAQAGRGLAGRSDGGRARV